MNRVVYSMNQSICMFDVRLKKTIWEWEMIDDIQDFYLMNEESGSLFVIITLMKTTGTINIHDPYDGQVLSKITMKPE